MIELSLTQYYILIYLLVGTFVGFCLESIMRWTNQDVDMGERIQIILLWPIMASIFIIQFIRGFFEK